MLEWVIVNCSNLISVLLRLISKSHPKCVASFIITVGFVAVLR